MTKYIIAKELAFNNLSNCFSIFLTEVSLSTDIRQPLPLPPQFSVEAVDGAVARAPREAAGGRQGAVGKTTEGAVAAEKRFHSHRDFFYRYVLKRNRL